MNAATTLLAAEVGRFIVASVENGGKPPEFISGYPT
jgi:hypothetical protein